ncbi:phenylalanine-4-hydroxylase-like protein [Syncephalis plumigaleata]|nr:phenylalanine-4-hydroxylase-like protein [Syncephalis plumigaleata]
MHRVSRPTVPTTCLVEPSPKVMRDLTLTFSVDSEIGHLTECLSALKPFNASLVRIESRPNQKNSHEQDIFVQVQMNETDKNQVDLEAVLGNLAKNTRLIRAHDHKDDDSLEALVSQVPAFPRSAKDLDEVRDKVNLECEELEPDHPGVSDTEYRQRRIEIAAIASNYLHGQPLPRIDYTQKEIETWRAVYRKSKELYPTHACRDEDNIPQQPDITEFLKKRTGFIMRPVMGLLTSRQFLNCLAFRVFCATQYIRHHSSPFYSIEPDLCHELFGHVALLADPDYAAFCQEIGLASLGATDEEIDKLSSLFMYTVEFGMCRENDQVRAYGAGVLASIAELEFALTDKATHVPLDPHKAALQKFPITGFQPVYFVAESLADVQVKVREFISTLSRPFDLRYDPETETVTPIQKISSFDNECQVPIAPAM